MKIFIISQDNNISCIASFVHSTNLVPCSDAVSASHADIAWGQELSSPQKKQS
jgi:hypothetical protein